MPGGTWRRPGAWIDRMARTVDDLDAHGGLAFDPSDTRALDLAAEASELAAEHAGPAGVRDLRLSVAALAPVVVSADRQAVRTVAGNVLANAVRLAPRNSTITLTAGTRGDWAYLAVTDEGPGIDEAEHLLVFRAELARSLRDRSRRHRDRDSWPRPCHRPPGRRSPRRPPHAHLGSRHRLDVHAVVAAHRRGRSLGSRRRRRPARPHCRGQRFLRRTGGSRRAPGSERPAERS